MWELAAMPLLCMVALYMRRLIVDDAGFRELLGPHVSQVVNFTFNALAFGSFLVALLGLPFAAHWPAFTLCVVLSMAGIGLAAITIVLCVRANYRGYVMHSEDEDQDDEELEDYLGFMPYGGDADDATLLTIEFIDEEGRFHFWTENPMQQIQRRFPLVFAEILERHHRRHDELEA